MKGHFSSSHVQHDAILDWMTKTTHAFNTCSSLPGDWFHTETSGRPSFTWYWCKVSYQNENLDLVQQPGWTCTGIWLVLVWDSVLVSCKQIQSHKREPGWTSTGMKVIPVSYYTCQLTRIMRVSHASGSKTSITRIHDNFTCLTHNSGLLVH